MRLQLASPNPFTLREPRGARRVEGRVIGAALLLIVGGCAGRVRPTTVDARDSSYLDDDRTQIHTASVTAGSKVSEAISVRGRYLVDVISSASVDVVSAATKAWRENRHEGEGAVAFDDGTRKASASAIYSVENDWESVTGGASLGRDFFEHRLTLTAGVGAVDNRVGRAEDSTFRERLRVLSGSLNGTIIVSRTDLVDLGLAFGVSDGYHASPYRFARFEDASAPGSILAVEEAHPERRVRQSLTVRWNRHLLADSALRSHARVYADDWGLRSLTGGTELVLGLGALETGLSVRGYMQQGASFYRDVYPQRMRYMTADRELGDFWDVFAGARVAWHRESLTGRVKDLRLETKLTWFHFELAEFSRLPRRDGIVGELAIGATF